MISEPNQPVETPDTANLEDSGFLSPEVSSDPADADYADGEIGSADMRVFSHSFDNVDVPDAKGDRSDERQKRIMSRIPQ